MELVLTPALAVKLASMVIHVEEATGPRGHSFDVSALRGLSKDPEVREWLDSFDPAYLPVIRRGE